MSRSSEIRSMRYKAQKQREEQLRELELMRQREFVGEFDGENDRHQEHHAAFAGHLYAHAAPNPENVLPLNDHSESFNLVPLLASAIKNTPYYKQSKLKSFNELVDSIYLHVTHLSPYDVASGVSQRPASPAFCLLMKAFEMKLTKNQMQTLLTHQDSPFIRCIGGLYLRYLCKFDLLLEYIQPLLSDSESFVPFTSPKKVQTTVKEWTKDILTSMKYTDTLFPRIPVMIERRIVESLSSGSRSSSQGAQTSSLAPAKQEALKAGTLCRAIYWEDGLWYDARIEEPGDKPDTYWVTFLPEEEYGNQEQVELKDIQLLDSAPAKPDAAAGDGAKPASAEDEKPEESNKRLRQAEPSES